MAVGTGTALAVAGGGMALSALSGMEAARMQGRAAEEQLRFAQSEADRQAMFREEEKKIRAQDRELMMRIAQASPAELANIEQSINIQNQNIARVEKMVNAADPAIIEAGKQALELMQGKAAAGVSIAQKQREKDRAALEAKLARQLGTGYANTTAGQQALNEFDSQTAATMQGIQQQTLKDFMGYSATGLTTNPYNNVLAGANILGNIITAPQGRQMESISRTPLTPNTQIPSTAQYAGAQYVGGALQNQAFSNMFGNVANLAALYGLSGGQGSSANVTTGPATTSTGGSYTNYGNYA